jgi:hypothetical protein
VYPTRAAIIIGVQSSSSFRDKVRGNLRAIVAEKFSIGLESGESGRRRARRQASQDAGRQRWEARRLSA